MDQHKKTKRGFDYKNQVKLGLLTTSAQIAAQPKCPCDDVPTLGRFSGTNHNGIYFIGQLGAVVSGAFIVPNLHKLLPASQVPIGLPTQWLESCLP